MDNIMIGIAIIAVAVSAIILSARVYNLQKNVGLLNTDISWLIDQFDKMSERIDKIKGKDESV